MPNALPVILVNGALTPIPATVTPANGTLWDTNIARVNNVAVTSLGLPVFSQPTADTSNPMLKVYLRSAATTNATSVKAAPGNTYNWIVLNRDSDYNYLHIVDKASAPTPGSETTNYLGAIPLPSGVFVPVRPGPFAFVNNGIAFYLTKGDGSSTDSTAVLAGAVEMWFEYF